VPPATVRPQARWIMRQHRLHGIWSALWALRRRWRHSTAVVHFTWGRRAGVSRSIRTTTRTTRPSVDSGVVALRDTQRARRLSASAEPLPVQRSSRTGRAPNLEALHVSSVMLVSVEDGAEPHLERQFLPSVAIEVEAECVQAFVTKCIWRGWCASGFTVMAMTVKPGRPGRGRNRRR
jgi:hypothetical protein